MPKKETAVDLSWQTHYAEEYKRTCGCTMSFSPVEAGGWYTVTTIAPGAVRRDERRMRRSEAIANIERLRARPDHVPYVGESSTETAEKGA